MIVNRDLNTRVDEVAQGIYRISIPEASGSGGFTFNQYLIRDDAPLLFHTGKRKMFHLVREAIDAVLPAESIRFLALSHFEADECGALNEFLDIAPHAEPVCGQIAARISIADFASRRPRALGDGEKLELGAHVVQWCAAPHLPHGWDCGYLFDLRSRSLLCGDLFTQGGARHAALTESDILEPSEALRSTLDYYAHAKNTDAMLEQLASLKPTTMACMHGAAWSGDGAKLLQALAERLRQ